MLDFEEYDTEEEEWESESSRRATALLLGVGMALCVGMAGSVAYWFVINP